MLLTGPPPAPASFYSGWRSAIFPAPPTDLELLEDVSGHWELSAVKRLLSAFLAVKNTHITLFLCELRVCEERDTTVERATCHLQQADYKELETLR